MSIDLPRRPIFLLVLWFWIALLAPPSFAAKPAKVPAPPQAVTSVEGITEHELGNGLRVLLFPDQSKSTITVNITYLVGSRHEGYGESGMAHLLEHMLFKGTPRFPNIPQQLTARGARPNGTTWYDRTNYYETFPASDDNLRWALDLESDRMVNSFVADKDLQSEFSVVRNEFEAGENDPGGVLLERVMSTAYLWHNYGKSTIGSRADIERVPIDNLRAFYQRFYQPDNAVLVVAGRIDPDKTLRWANEYFGKIPRPTRKLPATYTVEPTQDGERHVTLRRVGDVQVTAAGYHVPAGAHPDFPAVQLLFDVLTNEPAGRLYKALVETGLATQVGGFAFSLKEPGYAYVAAEVLRDKSLAEATRALLGTLDTLRDAPVTAEEVDRARNRYLRAFQQTYFNSERASLQLSEYIAQGDWRLWFLQRDRLEKVTADDVNRVAAAYLKPANRTTGQFIPDATPDRAEIPAAPAPAEQLKDYVGRPAPTAGETFDPSPESIQARLRSETLPGGAQISFINKTTRGNTVNVSLSLRIGSVESLAGQAVLSRMTAAMLRRGTTTRDLQQINDALGTLKSNVQIGGGGQNVFVNISTTRDQLLPTLEIVADLLRNPSFPQAELDKLRADWLAGIDAGRNDPNGVAGRAIERLTAPYPVGDFRRGLDFDEEAAAVNAVTVADLARFHREFYGAAHATVAVVGEFDPATTRAALGGMLANWSAPVAFQRAPNQYFVLTPSRQQLATPDKANAVMLAELSLPLRDDAPDYPALVLGNFMLGGGFLNSRLATRIRQQDGLSYGVASRLFADPFEPTASFTGFAIYNPANSARLVAAFREEIERVRRDGFRADELREAKTGWLEGRNLSRSQDATLAGQLSNQLRLDRTPAWDADFERRVAALTVDDVNAAFRKWIQPDALVIVEAGDFRNPVPES
ncbi:MAG: pitrilysin family protein [Steroidobacteraceae bacterium]